MKRVAVITGASSGIGQAAVVALLQAGYAVYACSRRLGAMKPLEQRGARLESLDVTDNESISRAVDRIAREAGRIDVLVNNAGYGSYGAVEDVPLAEARRQFEVNVFGLGRLTQLVLPVMRQQRAGRIVNVSSIGGKIHEPLGGWYHATKFAVEGLSDCLRAELKPFGIDVVVIEPGAIRTEWSGIAREKVLAVSGQSAYGPQARERARMLAYADSVASPPEVVARVIVRAVSARRPQTRYAVGSGARFLLFCRSVLPDRQMDWLMASIARRVGRGHAEPGAAAGPSKAAGR